MGELPKERKHRLLNVLINLSKHYITNINDILSYKKRNQEFEMWEKAETFPMNYTRTSTHHFASKQEYVQFYCKEFYGK